MDGVCDAGKLPTGQRVWSCRSSIRVRSRCGWWVPKRVCTVLPRWHRRKPVQGVRREPLCYALANAVTDGSANAKPNSDANAKPNAGANCKPNACADSPPDTCPHAARVRSISRL